MKKRFKMIGMLLVIFFIASGCNKNTTSLPLVDSKKEVIIDTDMGFDDWMAVLFLLRSDDIIVKGITINCTGLTYCSQGALNASKLLSLVVDNKPQYNNMPIYYGATPTDTLNYVYPKILRDEVSVFNVPGFKDLKANGLYKDGAGEFIYNMLTQASKEKKQFHFISLGTSTNFAQAINIAKENNKLDLFKGGLAMYYKGGGVFGEIIDGKVTNNNIKGNINIPNLHPSTNTQAEWNIYPDAIAHEVLIQNKIPQTFIPLNLTKDVPMTEESWKYLDKNAKSLSAKFVAAAVYTMGTAQNWEGLEYWDPAVAFAILYPEEVKKSFKDISICVDTTNDIKFHGTTYIDIDYTCKKIDEKTYHANIYYKLNSSKIFYDTLLDVLN